MPTRIPKIWGHEVVLHNHAYCCKLLCYDGVRTSSKHFHKEKHETFVVVRGTFDIEWEQLGTDNKGAQKFGPGAALVLEPMTVHRVTCVDPAGGMIVEASSHDDPEDCVRLEDSVNPFA